MMRHMLTIMALILPVPALAWEAGRVGARCTLTHVEDASTVLLTHDPAGPLFTLSATRPEGWPEAPVFGIAFVGGAELTITTVAHALSTDRRTVTVTDTGFGNVLAGLSRNSTATLFLGEATLVLSLADAAPEVAEFAACETTPSA